VSNPRLAHERVAFRQSAGERWSTDHPAFTDPHIFHRYVIASSGPNFADEANYAREHDRLPVRLHFVMEESDSEVATLERFLDTLASRAYAGLKVSNQVLNCTHCAIEPPAFQAGLVAVFA
jgi:hypothetical protein